MPWLVIGDFNVVLTCEEKKGGRAPLRISMQEFRDCLESCNLVQAPKSGIQFSWCSNKVVGVRGTSDHGALLGGVVNISRPNNIPFKYQPVWTTHPDFIKVIQYSWVEVCNGNPTFIFISKLKRLKNILKKWNWEVFGDLRIKIKTTKENVLAAALESDADPENIELLNKLVIAIGENDLASQQYNELMRAKSRIQWVKECGANTAFFLSTMRIRKAYNNISELEDTEGNLVTGQDQISYILVSHYQKKFEKKNVAFDDELFDVIPKVLTDEDNVFLDAIPSQDEIKNAVLGMNADSAPRPDGFPGSLYKFAWEIIGMELVEVIQYCWSNRIITDRIGVVIGRMVSEKQGAFIKGRNIHEKIVLASELVNELDFKRRGGNVGLKINIT
ncbi:uncharacterized protein LOC113296042 [Papaver somniferum]|uniref:uncharacterized protein LOC113296042 n=1 Tax=Papaver somniferum TaxID=3469 RepID=UPI000E6F6FEF|nr:uncharacterized protein LOC113296042 [Papaver somniferum]